MTTTTHYAVIDATNPTGAVYGVGTTARAAEAQARETERSGERGTYAIVPCTAAAAAYVDEHGGAPSRDLTVTARGVSLRSEEE